MAPRKKKGAAKKTAAVKKEKNEQLELPEQDADESMQVNDKYDDESQSENELVEKNGKKIVKQLTYSELSDNEQKKKNDFIEDDDDSEMENDELNATRATEPVYGEAITETESENDISFKKPPTKAPAKNQSNAKSERVQRNDSDEDFIVPKDMPTLNESVSAEEEDADGHSEHEDSKGPMLDAESPDEESHEEEEEEEPPAKAPTKSNAKKANAAKTVAKAAPKAKKGAKITENQSNDDEKEEPTKKMPTRGKKAKEESPKAKEPSPKKTRNTKATAKSKIQVIEQAKIKEDYEEPAKKTGPTRAIRKQKAVDVDETEKSIRKTKSGKPVKTAPKKKVAAKEMATVSSDDVATSKAKGKAKSAKTETDDNEHNVSIHLNMKQSSTIPQLIAGAIELLSKSEGKSSYQKVREFLAKEAKFDVDKHSHKIKNQIKEMFESGEIIPVNKLKGKPNVSALFKLKKKKPVSAQKRKSILMAEKKKAQKAPKKTKQPAKKVKKPTKTTTEEELEEFDDEEDVPAEYR